MFVEYNNENGYYYDFDSGSFIGANDLVLSLDGFPAYGFNRAWQNRQDLDSSVVIDNVYPTDAADVSPRDKNKWVIMPKWECPMLDFPLSDYKKDAMVLNHTMIFCLRGHSIYLFVQCVSFQAFQ